MVAQVLELVGTVRDRFLAVLRVVLVSLLVALELFEHLLAPGHRHRVSPGFECGDDGGDILRDRAAGRLGLILRPCIGGIDGCLLDPDLGVLGALLGEREPRGQERNQQRRPLRRPAYAVLFRLGVPIRLSRMVAVAVRDVLRMLVMFEGPVSVRHACLGLGGAWV